MMMFAMTATVFLSFVPYFVIHFLQTYDHTSGAWEVLAQRSYAISSAKNPAIIAFFNLEFRRFIVDRVLCCGHGARREASVPTTAVTDVC
ncbi:hypothetical protein DPMN_168061 [Dreissena polymorpha]|uniref:G-protein coupled receptors family 1 profile domain-containing protein n=1 Tax=Dreissena polymorpha TaxID=45954 RepID=A0A9D4F5Q4_DREPO|nr:hypothetical protein DPMN_168061 [Dreissena polymorpha]